MIALRSTLPLLDAIACLAVGSGLVAAARLLVDALRWAYPMTVPERAWRDEEGVHVSLRLRAWSLEFAAIFWGAMWKKIRWRLFDPRILGVALWAYACIVLRRGPCAPEAP